MIKLKWLALLSLAVVFPVMASTSPVTFTSIPVIPATILAGETVTPIIFEITNHYHLNLPITAMVVDSHGHPVSNAIVTRINVGSAGDCGTSGTHLHAGLSCLLQYSITAPVVTTDTAYSYTLEINYGMSSQYPLKSPINFTSLTGDYAWVGSCQYDHSGTPPYYCTGKANSLLEFNGKLYAAGEIGGGPGNGAVSVMTDDGWTSVGIFEDAIANRVLLGFNNTLYVAGNDDSSTAAFVFHLVDDTTWEPLGGVPIQNSNNVFSLAVFNNNIHAGTDKGVYMYSAGTNTWTPVGSLPYQVNALTVFLGQLYAGTNTNGVWVFNGSTWSQAGSSALDLAAISSLIVANSKLNAGVMGSTLNGVYELSTGIWTNIGTLGKKVISLGFDNVGQLLAGTIGNGVYMYNGSSWSAYGTSLPAQNVLSLELTSNGSLYAGLSNTTGTLGSGVFEYDAGVWNSVALNIPGNGEIIKLVEWNNALYVSTLPTDNAIYQQDTTQDPATWTQVGASFTDLITDFVGVAGAYNTLFASSGGKIYVYNSGWVEFDITGLPNTPNAFNSTKLYVSNNQTLYTGGTVIVPSVYLYNGSSWVHVGSNDPFNTVNTMVEFNGSLYTGGQAQNGTGVSVLLANNTWQVVGSNQPGNGIVNVLYVFDGSLYAGTGTGVYKLNGPTWELAGLGLGGNNPANIYVYTLTQWNNNLFVGTGSSESIHGGDVYELVSGNWTSTGFPAGPSASLLVFGGLLKSASGFGLYTRETVLTESMDNE